MLDVEAAAGAVSAVVPSSARQIALPEPAVWVHAFDAGEACTAVWLDESRYAGWTVSEPPRWGTVVGFPPQTWSGSALQWFREESYRRLPVWVAVACAVGERGELTCRHHACTDTVATQPPARCRGEGPPWSRARSAVQRTHPFVPTHPWWRAGLLDGGVGHVCVRREGAVVCYALERDVARPTPVSTPALDALGPIRDLSGAGSTACAVLADGSIHCWGAPFSPEPSTREEADQELAAYLASPMPPFAPRRIEGVPPAVQVSVGRRHACARTGDGRVFCWGDPRCLAGEIGDR